MYTNLYNGQLIVSVPFDQRHCGDRVSLPFWDYNQTHFINAKLNA